MPSDAPSQPATSDPAHDQPRAPDWVGWAMYLGASWTWCIGMFLPVLLVRDYGFWAFVVFAIPNVLGAAAMGWVIRTGAFSVRFVVDHRPAVAAFSLVTVLFQGYFIGWIAGVLYPGTSVAGAISIEATVVAGMFVALVLSVVLLMRIGWGMERWLATAAMLASWLVFVVVVRYRLNLDLRLAFDHRGSGLDLLGLAAACGLGFSLCPYLDRTFHLARASVDSSSAARRAFGLGFGIVFASMIVLTLLYADLIGLSRVNAWMVGLLSAHLVAQTAFTSAAHLSAGGGGAGRGIAILLAIAGATAAGLFAGDYGVGETGYRLFMGFYGLLAPAYVWLCVIPTRGRATTRWQWASWAITVSAAAPFYWLAFLERNMPWAAVGVAIVLASRALVRRA